MNHDDANKALPSYHDGEFTPDQAERIEGHLSSCADCRSDLANLQRVSAIVAPLAGVEDTEQFVQRVLARLPELTPSFWNRISVWWKIPVLAMSALLLVSVGSQITESAPSASALLCGDTSSPAAKHLCGDDNAQPDELMNLVWGDS